MTRDLLFSVSIADCVVTTYRGSGAGGQHRNKTDSGVRIQHRPSGVTVECCEDRSQHVNKRLAWRRLCEHPRFIAWYRTRVWEITSGKTIAERVDEQMVRPNLKIEIHDDRGRWVEVDDVLEDA